MRSVSYTHLLGYGLGKNWEDPRWEEVLDQLTFSDMENLFLHGYVKTEPLSVLGKPLAREADGPAQIGSFHQIPAGTGFPNAGILAQTWNNALAREMGRACLLYTSPSRPQRCAGLRQSS